MKFVADFHIHSPYSRATSHLLTPENIAKWAEKKGITVIGTGDFTHPAWLSELKQKLKQAEDGLYKVEGNEKVRFVISGEIGCIYKKDKKIRKIHHLVLLPDIETAEKLNRKLERIGNLEADGRPALGIDSKELLSLVLETSEKSFLIPAHIWTPWFSLFGSMSGFDSIEECFEELKDHIYALETGLSSDPPMNRLVSSLDRYILVSNSDAHSLMRIGREANVFDTDLSYKDIIHAMKTGEGFLGTIEFFPEEGKYHFDGHRRCNVCLDPKESIKLGNRCPVCGSPLTIGVLHRVYELADRTEPKITKDFWYLIPLCEIISEIMESSPESKKVKDEYERLISEFGSEISILMEVPEDQIEKKAGLLLAEAIRRMRKKQVIKKPGYDGEYGKIRIFDEDEKRKLSGQALLFSFEKKEESPVLEGLNPEQKEAVLHKEGHLIIVAGPGSGKTFTLTQKIAHLIKSGIAKADQILALTFTRKAEEEMRKRIENLIGPSDVWISTFHSFCLSLLREKGSLLGIEENFTVCSEWERQEILKEIVPEKRLYTKLLDLIPFLKRGKEVSDKKVLSFFENYRKRLKELNMLDLDDLEIETKRLLESFPEVSKEISEKRPFIFVDEYQDTNSVQVDILKSLAKAGSKIFAIGDPDQAIYGFRGAERENFFRFEEDFRGAKKIVLKRNYRSTERILKAASAFMKKESMECERKEEGEKISIFQFSTEKEEARFVAEKIEKLIGGISYFSLDSKKVLGHENYNISFSDIAVLYRINSLGDPVEEALKKAGIPYIRSGETPLREIFPVNLICRYLLYKLYKNSYFLNSYKRIISENGLSASDVEISGPVCEVIDRIIEAHRIELDKDSKKAVERIKEIALSFKDDLSSFLDTVMLERGIDHLQLKGDRVSLMTIHASKGLEWKVVFIIGLEDGIIPYRDAEEEEEKRLFYVGMTRAKDLLILSCAKRRRINGRIIKSSPSPFIKEIPEDIVKSEKMEKKKKIFAKQLSLFQI